MKKEKALIPAIIVAVFVVCVTVGIIIYVAFGKKDIEKKRISEMNDKELERFLSEYTKSYESLDTEEKEMMFDLLKGSLDSFDSKGETLIARSYTRYLDFAKEIDAGIEEYYGIKGCKSGGYADGTVRIE